MYIFLYIQNIRGIVTKEVLTDSVLVIIEIIDKQIFLKVKILT